jgi:hypothetical protein
VVLDLNGSCASGGLFKGGARVRPQWISGKCSENGTFSATVTQWDVLVQGSCSTPVVNDSSNDDNMSDRNYAE